MKERLSSGLKGLLAAALYIGLAAVLAVVMLASPASAAGPLSGLTVSPWAEEEVAKAMELGLYNQYVLNRSELTVPITREDFSELAIGYVAIQNHCDYGFFDDLMKSHYAEKDEDGYTISQFTDMKSYNPCHTLGIVTGYEDGTFRPDQTITRQEAAAMIVRAYRACGGTLPEEAAEITFADGDDIPDWAREDASALAVWNVMKGDQNGNFNPKGLCTYEQAIAMFLRLYESAPVSIAKGNVTPMFTYEQCMEEFLSRKPMWWYLGYTHTQIAEGSRGTVVREDMRGNMHPTTKLYCVYRDGGIRQIGDTWESGYWAMVDTHSVIESAQFSEDGKTLACTVSTPRSYADDGTVLTSDYYQMTVDIDALIYEVVPINPAQ